MSGHTPGPWHAYGIKEGRPCIYGPDNMNILSRPIATIWYRHDPKICSANAAFIAAAPETAAERDCLKEENEILTEAVSGHLAPLMEERDRLKAINGELLEALETILDKGMVAAPGPHWRWPDEYYEVFNVGSAAIAKAKESAS